MRVFEIIVFIIFLIGAIFNFNSWPGGAMLLTVSLTLLSMFYFLFSFLFFNKIKLKKAFKKESYGNIKPVKLIGTVGLGIGLSTLLMGILYNLLKWPGGDINLIAGLIIVLIILFTSLIKFFSTNSKYYIQIIIRSVLWCGIGLYIYINI